MDSCKKHVYESLHSRMLRKFKTYVVNSYFQRPGCAVSIRYHTGCLCYSYNRASLDAQKKLMQWCVNLIDSLRAGAGMIPFDLDILN